MELMEYLEVAPAGTIVEEAGDEGRSFFKLSDGSWTDEDDDRYGNIDVALEIEGNFKPFNLNSYRLYVGNGFSSRVWGSIEIDNNYSAMTIRDRYINYLLNSVGVTKEDKSMHINIIMDASAPVIYMMELMRILEELDLAHTININGK